MARSLGLATYRALSRRADAQPDTPAVPRPDGQVVWIHAGEGGNLLAIHDLAQRLVASRNGLTVLITLAETTKRSQPPPPPSLKAVIQTTAPSEHPAAVNAFFTHWAPDAGIWVWGALRPNLVLQAPEHGCKLLLIDADLDGIETRQTRWMPDLTRQILISFDRILARSAAGYKRIMQAGVPPSKAEQTTALLAGGQALTCPETDLVDLSAAMGGRPAWFATHILPKELPIVLNAHKRALRMSHRLILILQPASETQIDAAAAIASDQNMTIARWDDGQFPDETTQVMLSGDTLDRGLFFRVAPVSFLGSTVIQGNSGCDPLDAAALGSAILYGPKVNYYLPSYSRLAAAGAARIVNDADALAAAVSSLIAPDHAAAMAHAGWDVISEGAELTDRVLDLVYDILDLGVSNT